ncbi:MAG: hypothetical protein ACI88H_001568 [Cocleimonas sp.]|jgi:hypothetical protein
MIIFKFIPLFAFLLAAFWGLHHLGYFPDKLNDILFGLVLPSGKEWAPTWGGMMVLIGLITLYIEIFKSTRTSSISIVDHTLSTIVFVAFLVSWMILPWTAGDKGDSTFLLLTIMSFIDVIAGFTITIAAARRDFGLGGS